MLKTLDTTASRNWNKFWNALRLLILHFLNTVQRLYKCKGSMADVAFIQTSSKCDTIHLVMSWWYYLYVDFLLNVKVVHFKCFFNVFLLITLNLDMLLFVARAYLTWESLWYGNRYSLLGHHTVEELQNFGLTEAMIADQIWWLNPFSFFLWT